MRELKAFRRSATPCTCTTPHVSRARARAGARIRAIVDEARGTCIRFTSGWNGLSPRSRAATIAGRFASSRSRRRHGRPPPTSAIATTRSRRIERVAIEQRIVPDSSMTVVSRCTSRVPRSRLPVHVHLLVRVLVRRAELCTCSSPPNIQTRSIRESASEHVSCTKSPSPSVHAPLVYPSPFVAVNVNPSPSTPTTIACPGENVPASTFSASGSSSSLWIALRSGRAPNAGR